MTYTPAPDKLGARLMLNKVPEVVIWFWIIKILCTTVGESFADWINMTLGIARHFPTTSVANDKQITQDAISLVDSGDRSGAQSRITDLETAWLTGASRAGDRRAFAGPRDAVDCHSAVDRVHLAARRPAGGIIANVPRAERSSL